MNVTFSTSKHTAFHTPVKKKDNHSLKPKERCKPLKNLIPPTTEDQEVKRSGLPPGGQTYGFCQFGEQDGSS